MIDGLQSISDKLATPQKKLFDSVMQKDADLLAKAQLKDYKVAPRISAKDQDLLRFTGPNVMGFLMINNTLKALMKQAEGFSGQGASSKKKGAGAEGFSFSDVAEEALGDVLGPVLGGAATALISNPAAIAAIVAAVVGSVAITKLVSWIGDKIDVVKTADEKYVVQQPNDIVAYDTKGNVINSAEDIANRTREKERQEELNYIASLGTKYSRDPTAPGTAIKIDPNTGAQFAKSSGDSTFLPLEPSLSSQQVAIMMDRVGLELFNAKKEDSLGKKYSKWLQFMAKQADYTYTFHKGGYVPGNKSQEVEAVLLGGERVLSHKELDAFSSYIQEERRTLSEAFSLYTQTPFEVNVPEQKLASINPTIVTEVDTNAIRSALLGGMDSYSTIAREELSSGFDQLAKQFSMQEFIEASKLIKEAALHLKDMQLPASQNTIQPVVVKSEPQAFNPPVRSRR